jgi:hypothetical protein
VELRDALPKFREAGVKLYAISYDDVEALATFADAYGIEYPLLSDVDSAVIRSYGILNTELSPGDLPAYGVPFPGTYVTDEQGVVVEKFFHDSYKKRDSAELLIDSTVGRALIGSEAPRAAGGDEEVRVTAFLHGGRGTIRQGIRRHLVVRFELRDGLHIYDGPVPEGMVATSVHIDGPSGLVAEDPILPPTEPLRLPALDLTLKVWSGVVDIAVPIYPIATLISECRPLDRSTIPIELTVRYQACDDVTCLAPKTEKLRIEAELEPVDMPDLSFHGETGQRKSPFAGAPHMRRLLLRKAREQPLGALRSILGQIRLGVAARLPGRSERMVRGSRK